jgi:hypothetical protein
MANSDCLASDWPAQFRNPLICPQPTNPLLSRADRRQLAAEHGTDVTEKHVRSSWIRWAAVATATGVSVVPVAVWACRPLAIVPFEVGDAASMADGCTH